MRSSCSGTRAQFDKLTEALQQLLARLADLGSTPVLLAVPGNHDLQRPNERAPEVRALLNWLHDQDLRGTLFWHDADGKPYRDVVDTAFAEYTRWTQAWRALHPPPAWLTVRDAGLLPGEFAASVRRDGISLGIASTAARLAQWHWSCRRTAPYRATTTSHHASLLEPLLEAAERQYRWNSGRRTNP
jgi:hypothetical protein